jgi:putative lipoprotein (rSAM/lipoprotein system)
MKKILLFKRGLLKKILNLLGVCSAGLIVSCAKYGALVSTIHMDIKGMIQSKDSAKALEGIQVELRNTAYMDVVTDSNGEFLISSEIDANYNTIYLNISDIDGALNGRYKTKDTVLDLSSAEIDAHLKKDIDIRLEKE